MSVVRDEPFQFCKQTINRKVVMMTKDRTFDDGWLPSLEYVDRVVRGGDGGLVDWWWWWFVANERDAK